MTPSAQRKGMKFNRPPLPLFSMVTPLLSVWVDAQPLAAIRQASVINRTKIFLIFM